MDGSQLTPEARGYMLADRGARQIGESLRRIIAFLTSGWR